MMGLAEFIIGPAKGRTRWLNPSYVPPTTSERALTQILAEPLQRTLPRKLGGRVIVTGSGVVVEAVIGALVNESFVRNVRGRECGIKIRPSRGDARVKLTVLCKERRLDFGSVGGARLAAVERNRSSKIAAHPHRQLIDNAAAEAKPDGAELAGGVRARFQPRCGGKEILPHF